MNNYVCPQCNKNFSSIKSGRIFCSYDCHGNWRSDHTISYEELVNKVNKGEINRVCKHHGELPKEKIKVNKLKNGKAKMDCKICDTERARKRREKYPEECKKKSKLWFQANKDKVKIYKDKENETKKFKRKNDELYRKKYIKWGRDNVRRQREELRDGYIKSILRSVHVGKKNGRDIKTYDKSLDFSEDVIDLKRKNILLKRIIKQKESNSEDKE